MSWGQAFLTSVGIVVAGALFASAVVGVVWVLDALNRVHPLLAGGFGVLLGVGFLTLLLKVLLP